MIRFNQTIKHLFLLIAATFAIVSFVSCGTDFSSSSSSGSGSSGSSSGHIYVILYHPGKSGYEILSKKVIIGGKTVSNNGKGTSSKTKVNVSGRLSYSTYESYKKGGTSTFNHRTGGTTMNFTSGKTYTFNCATGSAY